MPYNSKYNVKYHLIGDGAGSYNIKLYIRDSEGKILLDGVSYNPPNSSGMVSGSEIMTRLTGLANDSVIDGLIKLNTK